MWIQISSGKGPDECELAVSLFLRSYRDELSKIGIKTNVIDLEAGNIPNNFKSVLLSLECQEQDDPIDIVSGTVLWICKSPYRPNHKRKNWFINVEAFRSSENLSFSVNDVKFEAMRSSGPGGQNVNKVESAVRALHIPTGLTTTASEERSQYMNKKLALGRLENLIKARNEEKANNNKKSMWMQHNTLERGNPLRTYEGIEFKIRNKY